jgi:DNA-directed RNA polymerase specialized sigma24 family protein
MKSGETTAKPSAQEFETFFKKHYELVYRTAYSVTGRTEDAEDIVQTIFLKLVHGGSPFDLGHNP